MTHRARQSLHLLAYALLPVVAFLAWVHPSILNPVRTGWAINGGDWGATALGLAAYLRAGNWPASWTPLLMAPEGIHVLFMDGNPLLAFLLKPFASFLPPGVQFIGLWLLACLILHMLFARLLVGRFIVDPVRQWLGTALLMALPTLYARLVHVNLCAHWLLLWALWLFLDPVRRMKPGWWLSVIGVAGLVHSYLLLMVGAIWASAMLRAVCTGAAPDRARVVKITLAVGVELVGLILLHGVADPIVSSHTYGHFSMPLDALINPDNPGFSALMPSTGPVPGEPVPVPVEGFQYLGAGLIALIVVMAVDQWRRRHEPPGPDRDLEPLKWLVPAGVVLTALAVSNLPMAGHRQQIQLFALPSALIDALDMVRASGRLFWPVSYTLVLVAIVLVARLRHGRALLVAALLLQVIDIAPMFGILRPLTAQADDPTPFHRLIDRRWPTLVARARDVTFLPADDERDRGALEELGWYAMIAGRPIRFMYVARRSRAMSARLAADAAAFAANRVDPHRLYVLLPGQILPPSVRERVLYIDGLKVVPPSQPIS